ncbi:hypothetical protein D3C87_1761880 [compost metagenome]
MNMYHTVIFCDLEEECRDRRFSLNCSFELVFNTVVDGISNHVNQKLIEIFS